jgi:hypothetical protein
MVSADKGQHDGVTLVDLSAVSTISVKRTYHEDPLRWSTRVSLRVDGFDTLITFLGDDANRDPELKGRLAKLGAVERPDDLDYNVQTSRARIYRDFCDRIVAALCERWASVRSGLDGDTYAPSIYDIVDDEDFAAPGAPANPAQGEAPVEEQREAGHLAAALAPILEEMLENPAIEWLGNKTSFFVTVDQTQARELTVWSDRPALAPVSDEFEAGNMWQPLQLGGDCAAYLGDAYNVPSEFDGCMASVSTNLVEGIRVFVFRYLVKKLPPAAAFIIPADPSGDGDAKFLRAVGGWQSSNYEGSGVPGVLDGSDWSPMFKARASLW